MSNFNFFTNLFGHVTQKELIDFSTNICVENSKGVTIRDNTINHNIFLNGIPVEPPNIRRRKLNIPFKEAQTCEKLERALLNIEYMEEFIAGCNVQGICPTFRYYALFSHLSTLRKEADFSDYNQMILQEKKCFEKMLELNYHIKLIVSLDLPIIITKWGYTLQETEDRITNLCDNVDVMTKDHNIEIVIDEKNSMNGTYILDNCVLIRAIDVDPIKKYSMTKFETNLYEINNAINEFDQKFEYCKFSNQAIRKWYDIDSYSELIRGIIERKIECYYKMMEEMKF